MFDIPMNTKGSLDSSSLTALMGGSQPTTQPTQQPVQQPIQQPTQQPVQQSYGGVNQPYNTQPQQTQQPQGQQFYGGQPQMQQPTTKQRPQGNGVRLKKGQKFALGQPGQQLGILKVCLGWDVVNVACDLDASAFMLDQSTRVVGDDWFVFYGQKNSPDGSVTHSGDSDGTASTGDDEIITIDTNRINPSVQKITFVVTINEALEQGLNFSMVQNAYVRVVDGQSGQEIAKFELTDYYSNVTAMVVGELYKHNGNWKFNAIGDGVAKDLAGLCAMYGVNVAD